MTGEAVRRSTHCVTSPSVLFCCRLVSDSFSLIVLESLRQFVCCFTKFINDDLSFSTNFKFDQVSALKAFIKIYKRQEL